MSLPDQNRTMLGVLFMVAFCIIAPVMDAFAKATPEHVPVAQILAARFGIQVMILVPLALALQLAARPTGRDISLHLARGAALLAATACFFTAVRYMPIANAIAIFFVSPFVTTLLGAVFLKETVGWRRVSACLVGFGGALLVIRPSFTGLGAVALLPLSTAFFFAVYMLLTRSMSQRLHPLTLQAHTALAACLIVFPPLIAMDGSGSRYFDPVWPTGLAIWTLLGVGLIATVSHLCITYALRFAPASTVAPLQYLEIVGATAVGYIAFNDFPKPLTWLGIAIIVASGLFLFARERDLGRKTDRPPPPP